MSFKSLLFSLMLVAPAVLSTPVESITGTTSSNVAPTPSPTAFSSDLPSGKALPAANSSNIPSPTTGNDAVATEIALLEQLDAVLTQALTAQETLAAVQETALANKNDALNTELQKANDMLKAEQAALAQGKALAAEQAAKASRQAAGEAAASLAAKRKAICFQLRDDSAIISQAAEFIGNNREKFGAYYKSKRDAEVKNVQQVVSDVQRIRAQYATKCASNSECIAVQNILLALSNTQTLFENPKEGFLQAVAFATKDAQDFGNRIVAQVEALRKELKCSA